MIMVRYFLFGCLNPQRNYCRPRAASVSPGPMLVQG